MNSHALNGTLCILKILALVPVQQSRNVPRRETDAPLTIVSLRIQLATGLRKANICLRKQCICKTRRISHR